MFLITPLYKRFPKVCLKGQDSLTLFDMVGGGGMMAPQTVFDHSAQTLRRRKLKLGDF